MSTATEAEPYIWIAEAARVIGMHRGRMRAICISAGVAVRWGGSDESPYLKVKLSAARRAVDQLRHVPKKTAKVQRGRAAVVVNPDVTC